MMRGVLFGFLGLIAFLSAALIWQLNQLNDRRVQNDTLRSLLAGRDISPDSIVHAPPEVRLARALYLHKKHRYEDALATIDIILDEGDPRFRAKVHYNLGNIYLSQAMEMVENFDIAQAVPLVELAKDSYRQALRIDSGYWDAKYNLEAAMRLVPEIERLDMDRKDEKARKDAPWTTVPGFPRGLP
ncbi:MAG: tetratricopeptide repeat protein [Methylococcaceae bacterium]|nr:tetratricopeptide repeat protein [Methylococcaceae bacterium]